MDRRQAMLFGLSTVAALATGVGATGLDSEAAGNLRAEADSAKPFSIDILLQLARETAKSPYVERQAVLPKPYRNLTARQYRDIMFRADASSWKDNGLQISLKALPCGYLYETPVDIHIVENGAATPLMVDGPAFAGPQPGSGGHAQIALPYSGLSLNGPSPQAVSRLPIVTFQGASYFKAVAPGQTYGLSARGLAIKTAHPDGEEIPVFREFWIELPGAQSDEITLFALLDSPSTTGVYRFTLRPDLPTVVTVEMTLFPRTDIPFVGFAPLSSMFLFNEKNHRDFDDHRPAVHNSDGLSILNGMNEWIWRSLCNPGRLQISAFTDESPRGFGLIQRKDRFEDFSDGVSRFENRPSCWIEPVGDWGKGQVQLIEIPSRHEFNDNIAVFWRPAEKPRRGQAFHLAYKMHWGKDQSRSDELARVISTRIGHGKQKGTRKYSVEFERDVPFRQPVRIDSWASRGTLGEVTGAVHPNDPNRYMVSMELDPAGAALSELRIALRSGQRGISEIWLHRWTS